MTIDNMRIRVYYKGLVFRVTILRGSAWVEVVPREYGSNKPVADAETVYKDGAWSLEGLQAAIEIYMG